MTHERFEQVVNERIEKCLKLMCAKSDEYATHDKLHNFKVAAELQNCSPLTALAGMMAKHTVSVYDLIRDYEDCAPIDKEMWDEKIGDHINYLLLLTALIDESYAAESEMDII